MKLGILMTVAMSLLGTPAALQAEFQLKDSDRVVFFGDSFIEGKAVPTYVESFVRVRYPDLKTRFINPATRHFTAREGHQRISEVLDPMNPTVVVVVFGFQDPDRRPLDETRLAEFRADYAAIVQHIRSLKAVPVLVTPPCPRSRKLPRKPDVDYRAVVSRYATVIQELGKELNADVVDWFNPSAGLLETPEAGRAPRGRMSVVPPAMAQVVLSGLLLKHWQAEPIVATLTADWLSDQASASAGQVAVLRDAPQSMTLRITEFPLPWAIKSVSTRDLYQTPWPGDELCRYTLILKNAPPGIEMALGSKGIPMEAAALETGLNITGWAPLQSRNAALGILHKYIVEKSRYQGKYWGEVRPRRPREPELQQAFDLYSKALQEFDIGFYRIILGVPKTFDVSLTFRVKPLEAADRNGS